ncbi:MAG: hypothetical protein CVV47_07010 [Spirochaetae bacterium HGW-Spirochaetae-3]|jgi:phage terminase small subunit|nr:MAG: hypothetical protein CVV47_07010 [Spirochaetae bacterium HGW-Spirochaetae-3]
MPRPKVPTAEKKKKGTLGSYDKDRIDDRLPALMKEGIPSIIVPPDNVPVATEPVWYRVSGRLSAAGIWTDLDIDYLVQTCIELNQLITIDKDIDRYRSKMDEYESALSEVESSDLEEADKSNSINHLRSELDYYRNWWSKLLTKRMNTSASFVKYASKLGMSPSDRAGLKLVLVSADKIERDTKPKSALQRAATRPGLPVMEVVDGS